VAATTVSRHMLVSTNNADGPKSTSPGQGWLARLPVNFSVDHPPWCVSCRAHQTSPPSRTRRDTRHQEQENCRSILALITRHGARHAVANRRIRILSGSGSTGGCFNGHRIPLHPRHDRVRLLGRARLHYGRAVLFRSASSVNCLIRNRSERIHDSSVSPRNVNSRSNRCLPCSASTTSAFIHWINVLSLWIPP
jgi:hypothetical protein